MLIRTYSYCTSTSSQRRFTAAGTAEPAGGTLGFGEHVSDSAQRTLITLM